MEISESSRKFFFLCLGVVFAASTASIALQNLVWLAVLYWGWLYLQRPARPVWSLNPFPTWTLLWVFSFYLGSFLGINPFHSLETVHRYLTILLILFVGSMGMGLMEVHKLLKLFGWGSVVCALFGIGKHLILHQDRIDSFSGDKIIFGGLLMTALVIQLGFLMRDPRDLLLWIGASLNGWALLLTETRGAWLGFAAGFLMLGWRFNRRWVLAGLGLALVGYFFLPANMQERVRSITQLNIEYNEKHEMTFSYQTRAFIWDAGIRIIRDYPLGIGQGNIGEVFPRYRPPGLPESTEPHLHNNFLQIAAQNGWLGLVIYLGWIACYFLKAFQYPRRSRGSGFELDHDLLFRGFPGLGPYRIHLRPAVHVSSIFSIRASIRALA